MSFVFNRVPQPGRDCSYFCRRSFVCDPCAHPVAALHCQTTRARASDLSNFQRLNVMKSKLEAMRRSLSTRNCRDELRATAADKEKNPDDPTRAAARPGQGSRISPERSQRPASKEEKAEKYDTSQLD